MWTIFKVFIEFVTILLLFYVLVLWPRGMWDLSSLTRDWTRTPCIGRQSPNHWTAREVPIFYIYLRKPSQVGKSKKDSFMIRMTIAIQFLSKCFMYIIDSNNFSLPYKVCALIISIIQVRKLRVRWWRSFPRNTQLANVDPALEPRLLTTGLHIKECRHRFIIINTIVVH